MFDRSFNSKVSDWTSVFDSNVELGPYKFCWSRNGSSGPSSPNLKCSRDSLLSESVVFEKVRLMPMWSVVKRYTPVFIDR